MKASLATAIISIALLAGCSAQEPLIKTEVVKVPVRVMTPIPEELTEPDRAPDLPSTELTYGDVVTYSVDATGALESCNVKLEKIRELSDTIVDK